MQEEDVVRTIRIREGPSPGKSRERESGRKLEKEMASRSGPSSCTDRTLVGKYQLGRTIRKGAIAKVKLARNIVTGENVAIKMIDKEKVLKDKMIDQIKREISVMKMIKHPNVIRLYEVMASRTKLYLVLEFVAGGELFDKIVSKGRLKEDEAREYFRQLINAVAYCHRKGVCHRDLKPENLLLDANGVLKVSDFLSGALPQQVREDGLLHTTCGSPNYVAPEVIKNNGYDGAKADLWSCGVILFVLMAGYLPFQDSNLVGLYKKIVTANLTCPPWFSKSTKKLIKRILDPNPATRITVAEIIENEWFKKGYKAPLFENTDASLDEVDSRGYKAPLVENANISLDDVDAIFNESAGAEKCEGIMDKENELIMPDKTLSIIPIVESRRHANVFFGKYQEQLQSWNDAPTRLDISSEVLRKREGESKPVGVFDGYISNPLILNTSRDCSRLVGMDGVHLEVMYELLDLKSADEVRVIGICGIGGIGKTTLARYVYEQISQHFETYCFLENVRKIYQDNGPSGLQEEISKNLQGALTVCSSNVGSGGIKSRLRHRKVLLVADAVDKIEDLIVLPKDASWFGPGSRIIVITREKALLLACGIKHTYEVECLRYSEALQLFSQYAFKRSHPDIGFEQFSDRAVKLAGGLPLALQVFGSFLHGRVKDDWESALCRLEASTEKDNVDRINISPDVLDDEDESIASNILSELTSATSSDFDGLVAMDRHMKAIYKLLDLESNVEVRMIGICGMVGVGKTTLVRYAYERISRHFQNHCFLKNVKKIYQDHGSSGLQEEFLSKSLRGEAITISSTMDSDVIESRPLRDRKVLLVADGVDSIEQLNAFAKGTGWFGPGSVVILTAQDKSLLADCQVKHVYEVECLRYDEALQLFSQFAFKQGYPSTGFEWLSVHAIQLAGFLPLALKVFGSFLHGKCKEDWECALHRIEALFDKDTLEILKIGWKH